MKGNRARIIRISAGLAGLVLLGWVLTGQAAKPVRHRIPLTTDWSHRHVIFSSSPTAEMAARFADEPRFWQQIYRRAAHLMPAMQASERMPMNGWGGPPNPIIPVGGPPPAAPGEPGPTFHRDWAEDLGSGGTLTASFFPAKYSFDISEASCANDFVVYSTGLLSSPGAQASIVAYNNLYSSCTGTVPSVYWAYDTSGQILTSPVFSLDGSQIAFVETNGGFGILVVLKWASSMTETVTSPLTLTAVSPSAYQSCTAPCMTTIDLQDGLHTQTDDTTSSIFYDYANDIGWVGGARGWLHKITGVFKGTPAEVTTGGFPVQVNDTLWLSSPVYDKTSTNVFVGDASGYLYSVGSTTPTVTQSAQVDFGTGIVDGPIVDSNREYVYVFSSDDNSLGCAAGTVDCAGVFQFSPTFAAMDDGIEETVGNATVGGVPTPSPIYIGAFDSTYLASANATGNLYVCGNTGGAPILYQVPISAGVMQEPNQLPTLSGSTTPCSPVSDIQNPNGTNGVAEWIFLSVELNGISNGCSANGCVYNFTVTPWKAGTAFAQNEEVLDDHLNIQAVSSPGTSGAGTPNWTGAVAKTTPDGTITWQTQGTLAFAITTPPIWESGLTYHKGTRILDKNNNLEYCSHAGVSGGAVPSWAANVGAPTNDGTVIWTNLGALPTAALVAPGGTTGIIMDNIVPSGTLAGASQIYFYTLGSESCTGGAGGCAVQASQPGLN